MQAFSVSISQMVGSFWNNRQLIFQMAKRDILSQYRGSVLGLAWSFIIPLILLSIYSFVFSTIFKARWDTGGDSKTEFALVLFIGMIVHGFFTENFSRAPLLILNNVSYVKKVIFPLEVLPLISMCVISFQTLISMVVWMAFYFIVNWSINWTVVFVPIIMLPLMLIAIGVSWFVASLGVYFRDISQLTGTITTILLFLSPIFYPASMLPESFQTLIYLNPLTFFIEQLRDVFMWGELPNWYGLVISYFAGIVVAWSGFYWFQKTRVGFSDVL